MEEKEFSRPEETSRERAPKNDPQLMNLKETLRWTPVDVISKQVVRVGNIEIYGEIHTNSREEELTKAINTGDFTHLVLELPDNYQSLLDQFAKGRLDSKQLASQIKSPHYLKLIQLAKEKGVKVIAGDMSDEEILEWMKAHPKITKTMNPVLIAVSMVPERSHVTGRKISEIYQKHHGAKVLVSCGASHVPYILEGLLS